MSAMALSPAWDSAVRHSGHVPGSPWWTCTAPRLLLPLLSPQGCGPSPPSCSPSMPPLIVHLPPSPAPRGTPDLPASNRLPQGLPWLTLHRPAPGNGSALSPLSVDCPCPRRGLLSAWQAVGQRLCVPQRPAARSSLGGWSLGPRPVGHVGVGSVLSTCAHPSSVVLLLALHLCVFTMLGILLFTGEKVRPALLPLGPALLLLGSAPP